MGQRRLSRCRPSRESVDSVLGVDVAALEQNLYHVMVHGVPIQDIIVSVRENIEDETDEHLSIRGRFAIGWGNST